MTEQRHVGEFIRDERQKRGWTQKDLARRAGVAATTVSDVETGFSRGSVETLIALLAAFDLPQPEEKFWFKRAFPDPE